MKLEEQHLFASLNYIQEIPEEIGRWQAYLVKDSMVAEEWVKLNFSSELCTGRVGIADEFWSKRLDPTTYESVKGNIKCISDENFALKQNYGDPEF